MCPSWAANWSVCKSACFSCFCLKSCLFRCECRVRFQRQPLFAADGATDWGGGSLAALVPTSRPTGRSCRCVVQLPTLARDAVNPPLDPWVWLRFRVLSTSRLSHAVPSDEWWHRMLYDTQLHLILLSFLVCNLDGFA